MSAVATAVVAGAAITAGVGAISANSAANTQAGAQEQAAQMQQNEFNTITQQEQPFMTAGVNATNQLSSLLQPGGFLNQQTTPTFNASTVTNSPGYQFAQQQGLQQVANNQAPSVGALSGPALKALTNYATGTAAQYYNDYFNQANTTFNQQQTVQNNIFSRLSAIAGLGQNAASNTGTAGTALGTGAGQAIAAAGGSQAAGIVGAGNAISGGINSAGSYLTLNQILSQGGGGATPDPFAGTAQGANGLISAGS